LTYCIEIGIEYRRIAHYVYVLLVSLLKAGPP